MPDYEKKVEKFIKIKLISTSDDNNLTTNIIPNTGNEGSKILIQHKEIINYEKELRQKLLLEINKSMEVK